MIDKVKQFAIKQGYNEIKKLENWNGYEVYEPIMGEDAIIGIPLVIMVKGNNIRMSSIEEAFRYMDR